jgi:hypothetical protein
MMGYQPEMTDMSDPSRTPDPEPDPEPDQDAEPPDSGIEGPVHPDDPAEGPA